MANTTTHQLLIRSAKMLCSSHKRAMHTAASSAVPSPFGGAAASCHYYYQGMKHSASMRSRSHYTYSGPGTYQNDRKEELWNARDWTQRAFTIGIGGPVGSGKTHLVQALVPYFNNDIAVVTNDIFTKEDAEFLQRQDVLPASHIRAVETGGCPHAAIREDVSANLSALEDLTLLHHPRVLLCESGGDNLAANFSHELADLTIYVIDVAGGDKVPRKGGPGITQSDILVINKIDLAAAVQADLSIMERDALKMRGERAHPALFTSVKEGTNIDALAQYIEEQYEKAMSL